MLMPCMFSLGFLPGSDSVRIKDFIYGLPNLNLPVAANPELGTVLLGETLQFGHGIGCYALHVSDKRIVGHPERPQQRPQRLGPFLLKPCRASFMNGHHILSQSIFSVDESLDWPQCPPGGWGQFLTHASQYAECDGREGMIGQCPIIAVTSCALSGEEKRSRTSGCDEYVHKPFSPRQLLAKIRDFLQ